MRTETLALLGDAAEYINGGRVTDVSTRPAGVNVVTWNRHARPMFWIATACEITFAGSSDAEVIRTASTWLGRVALHPTSTGTGYDGVPRAVALRVLRARVDAALIVEES